MQPRAPIASRGPTALPGPAPRPVARPDLNGCPWHDVKAKLRDVGLRPTRQRMALGWILLAKGDRHVTVDGSKTYFDTNVTEHHHFFVEGENALLDIPDAEAIVGKMPVAPPGFEISRVDVVVRLKRKR